MGENFSTLYTFSVELDKSLTWCRCLGHNVWRSCRICTPDFFRLEEHVENHATTPKTEEGWRVTSAGILLENADTRREIRGYESDEVCIGQSRSPRYCGATLWDFTENMSTELACAKGRCSVWSR